MTPEILVPHPSPVFGEQEGGFPDLSPAGFSYPTGKSIGFMKKQNSTY
jgi:hypothetical protein